MSVLAILVAIGVILGDLVLAPAGGPPWYQLGLGLLAVGLVSLHHRLDRRLRDLREQASGWEAPRPR
ncbi:hypothetical protein [Saccharopolyspora griseoalba]|uniref:DUF3188 domain-containing protein n=1 Tax=Saccharopolyspora griseoalba TaxID=1431848 RepID=A0ABW2LWI9_9PSEU